jgi:hypothetical protein
VAAAVVAEIVPPWHDQAEAEARAQEVFDRLVVAAAAVEADVQAWPGQAGAGAAIFHHRADLLSVQAAGAAGAAECVQEAVVAAAVDCLVSVVAEAAVIDLACRIALITGPVLAQAVGAVARAAMTLLDFVRMARAAVAAGPEEGVEEEDSGQEAMEVVQVFPATTRNRRVQVKAEADSNGVPVITLVHRDQAKAAAANNGVPTIARARIVPTSGRTSTTTTTTTGTSGSKTTSTRSTTSR